MLLLHLLNRVFIHALELIGVHELDYTKQNHLASQMLFKELRVEIPSSKKTPAPFSSSDQNKYLGDQRQFVKRERQYSSHFALHISKRCTIHDFSKSPKVLKDTQRHYQSVVEAHRPPRHTLAELT